MISSHYLNKCIRIIEKNCYGNPTGVFSGDNLDRFCSSPKNREALHLLFASGEIKTDSSDGTERPFLVWLTDKGLSTATLPGRSGFPPSKALLSASCPP